MAGNALEVFDQFPVLVEEPSHYAKHGYGGKRADEGAHRSRLAYAGRSLGRAGVNVQLETVRDHGPARRRGRSGRLGSVI